MKTKNLKLFSILLKLKQYDFPRNPRFRAVVAADAIVSSCSSGRAGAVGVTFF